MGTTTFELIKKFGINQIVSIDIDKHALSIANNTAKQKGLTGKTNFILASALKMPFEDESFDVIINEAMLTMMSSEEKRQALKEYHRVLKKGGYLLTHDIMLGTKDLATQTQIRSDLTRAIYVNVHPYDEASWVQLFESEQFTKAEQFTGKMSLMNVKGMLVDEGLINAIRIIKNALKKANKDKFKTMRKTFKKHDKNLYFYARISQKE